MVAYLKKPTRSEGFQEIVYFLNGSHIRYALTKNPTIYVSLIKKFWQTATVRTVDNGEQEITATVDGKEFIITEAFVRRHLQLADVDSISVLPTTEIFDQLSLMGYMILSIGWDVTSGKRATTTAARKLAKIQSRASWKQNMDTKSTAMLKSHISVNWCQNSRGLGHEAAVNCKMNWMKKKRQRMAIVHEATQSFTEKNGKTLDARFLKDAEAKLDHEGSKRQKTNEDSRSVQEQLEEEEKDLSQEDLQQMMMVVPLEEVYVEAL
ncbi:hypothetical protein Tco_0754622 [Tanacetum coccineum]